MAGTVAITMAGMGSRFTKAGYRRPKYEIEALGRPLFDWSMMAVEAFRQAGWTFAFVTRKAERALPFLETRCQALDIPVATVVELDAPTDGQATSARYLAEQAAPAAPFLVFNIDTFVAPHAMRPDRIDAAAAGWIPCFPGPGDAWSFVRVDASGRAVEVREKTRIAPHASVGLYWFRSAVEYRALYRDFFRDGAGGEHGERYVAPMYNHLIAAGELVTIAELAFADVGMLGTPDQVAAFRSDPPEPARRAMVS